MSDTSPSTKASKLSRRLLNVAGGGVAAGDGYKLLPPSVVTPVLRDVGKLAASVAAVNTNVGNSTRLMSSAPGSAGSATGNPRNKCTLEPGHSLMDWIRLGNSGRDLSGVGALAGKMTVTPEEMRMHNKRDDAWIAIRGNVYNVTEYLSFHPGGVDEIMRGVGLPDATQLFDDVHPWVNYDKMLTKCYVGRLGAPGPSANKPAEPANVRFISPHDSDSLLGGADNFVPDLRRYSIAINDDRQVRFDWIQKHDLFILYFYTGPYSNPFFDIRRPFENKWTFVITFVESVFTFKFIPHDILVWPPRFKVFYETGKIEVGFEKQNKIIWPTFGLMEQTKRKVLPMQCKRKYLIKEHMILNKHTFMLAMQKTDLSLCNTPLGHHVVFYNDVNDGREFTPVPHLFMKPDFLRTEMFNSPYLTFIIRRYPDGRLSNFLYNKKVGDIILGSDPMGSFDLQLISDKEYFMFLAGGVGLAPFLAIIQFLLEKKIRPMRAIVLLLFNPTPEYQFLDDKLAALNEDQRFHYVPVVTRPAADYTGLSGHLTAKMLRGLIRRHFGLAQTRDMFFFVCGPTAFNNGSYEQLQEINADMENAFFFTSSAPFQMDLAALPTPVTLESKENTFENEETGSGIGPGHELEIALARNIKRARKSRSRRSRMQDDNANKHLLSFFCFCIPLSATYLISVRQWVIELLFGSERKETKNVNA